MLKKIYDLCFHKQTRRISLVAFFIAVVVIFGIFLFSSDKNTTHFELNHTIPEPVTFSNNNNVIIENEVPEINNNRKLTSINPLIINYDIASGPYAGAFQETIDDSQIGKHIQITPQIAGKWMRTNPNNIIFIPNHDWPTNTKFTVKLNKQLFFNDVHINRRRFTFKTPKATAKIDSFNIYPVTKKSQSVVGAAVIEFNHPINAKNFDKNISMKINGKKIKTTVKFDRFYRTALITTEPISVTNQEQRLRFKLNRITTTNKTDKTNRLNATTTIASNDNFFKIIDLTTTIADNKHGNPQQLILLNTTAQIAKSTELTKHINVLLLPKHKTSDEKNDNIPHQWMRDEINAAVLKDSKKIDITPVEFINPSGIYQYAFSYNVSDNSARYLYVSVEHDIKSAGGFILKNGIERIVNVSYPKRSVKIAGSGTLLSMAGDKKLGIVARGGVETAFVNLYKIKSSEINHLITQTYDLFSKPVFKSDWLFDAYDMSSVFQKKISFTDTTMNHVNYASVNLGEYLDRTYDDKTGIFIVKTGATENTSDSDDTRLILLTDLGIIRKINLDETSSIFISHLSNGTPASDIDVSVLGRNGNPIWSGLSDTNGQVDIPRFSWSEYKNEKEPVAIIAKKGNDISFIPFYSAGEQHVEYSKFDISGMYYTATRPISAYIFSDRGIYRPGETATIGCIIKNKNFSLLSGMPIKLELQDTRGRTLIEKKIALSDNGMFDISYKIANNSPTGTYNIFVYSLDSRGHTNETLGMASLQVEEFVPDTMKINAKIVNANTDKGWIDTKSISASVNLNNMFGTPATNRRVTAHAILKPIDFIFNKFSDYKFTSNFISGTGLSDNSAIKTLTYSIDLPDAYTDNSGNIDFNIDFNQKIPLGTYLLSLQINGFENNSGKSVQTSINSRVSDFEYLIGYKTNSNLTYLDKNENASIKLIAINSESKQIDVNKLKLRLIKRENLTSLIKDYNNYYKYNSVSHDTIVSTSDISISASGTILDLDTSNGGTYFLQILDNNDNVLINMEYFVASNENITMESDAKAELQIKLNKNEYMPGDTININVTAPYTGSGLITIERDKIYATKWFKTDKNTSIQSITLPKDFEGTGYINVSFVRDINSHDVFTSPYTYAVAPFTTDISKRKINIKLSAPEIVSDNKLTIEYESDSDAQIMIFAVNSGILQVAKYSIPNPIKHFFQKAALQVETFQILSLLLPEYKILSEFAQTGGSDYDLDETELAHPLKNPFANKNLPPVAYYSGIIQATAGDKNTITFDIPEYFNGSVKIYAVATNKNAIGSANTETKIQSPAIISSTTPTFSAPNDIFNVNAIISNLSDKSGKNATVDLSVESSDALKITTDNFAKLPIPENTEQLWNFGIQSGTKLGNNTLRISATLFDENGKKIITRTNNSDIVIRPINVLTNNLKFGVLNSSTNTIKDFHRDMYPEMSFQKLYISSSPDVLLQPLINYLINYEYSCTEQLVSKALPFVFIPEDKLIGTNIDKSSKYISETIQSLINRQNTDGSFNLWNSDTLSSDNAFNAETAYITAYTINFLNLAKRSGFNVPQNMLSRGLDYLRTYAGENIINEDDARAHAFAIYVITNCDYVTTSYIDNFEEFANKSIKNWQTKLMGAYIAASYKILKQNDKATNLISKYKQSDSGRFIYNSEFDNNVSNDAIYQYLLSKHFNNKTATIAKSIQNYINNGNYTSFNAANIIMSLASTTESNGHNISVLIDGKNISNEKQQSVNQFDLPVNTTKFQIKCDGCESKSPMFYTVLQQGFPQKTVSESNGIEIERKYYDSDGQEITNGNLGDMVTVKIFARTRNGFDNVNNVVISDLLPTGFIPNSDTISGPYDFNEIRFDRVLIYTDLTRNYKVFTYQAQMSVSGTFTVPPLHATAMNNPNINATTKSDKFTVSNANK